jgi:hypothetical protein
MMIKNLGARVASVWEGLRPMTKQMLVGVLESSSPQTQNLPQTFAYDAHSDWELSKLLTALDEQSADSVIPKDADKLSEISQLAETCVQVLEAQSVSAEIFIQLAARAIKQQDYNKLDKLSDRLAERFSAAEIAEIVRQTDLPQIRAIAYETLALMPVSAITALLSDPLYSDIGANALEQKAFEFESEDARDALEQYDSDAGLRNDYDG